MATGELWISVTSLVERAGKGTVSAVTLPLVGPDLGHDITWLPLFDHQDDDHHFPNRPTETDQFGSHFPLWELIPRVNTRIIGFRVIFDRHNVGLPSE